ncbi:ras-related protein Rab-26 isoform X1 [Peromyscus californicus insignis]|uniref:ras-related protein Rab-26 isoform X1 n=1 Tax=Peromyscus californicus insignis TaxID=564181 RepID=UPI0022A71EEE|nr:ras-related protein Rab-26 isoform X1 [Peromyscus californicus insignis]
MSRKKTPKSKAGSVPAASTLPTAANRPRLAGPRTARPGPEALPNGPPQSGRPSLGGTGDLYDVAFKVMLVGDSGVGKTCLLVRFKDGAFLAGTFISTVGIDFRNKVLDVDGMKVKLQIWDTAGQERFRSVTHAYYRDAHALLLLYDITNKDSFDNIQAWLTEIQEYAQQDVVLMLLGNKVDSAQERVVKREDGEKLAKVSPNRVGDEGVLKAVTLGLPPFGQHLAGSSCLQEYGLPFMETSAKTGLNVDLAFTAIAKELKQRSTQPPREPHFRLHDYVKREGQGVSCCRL